jgi:cytosine/uracil/thiamine/allantoin permease
MKINFKNFKRNLIEASFVANIYTFFMLVFKLANIHSSIMAFIAIIVSAVLAIFIYDYFIEEKKYEN